MNPRWQRLVSDNEQDRAMMLEWWKDASTAAKLAVWEAIQKTYDDPATEIMSRFAQVAFGEMLETHGEGK